jgi:outer membrane lipoprotein-sorting protein
MRQMLSFFWLFFLLTFHCAHAQEVNDLMRHLRTQALQVKNYTATGTMKTNVPFLRVPESPVTIYYKSPDRMKIKNEKGISFIPKSAVGINLSHLLSENDYNILDAGYDQVGQTKVRVLKLLPKDDNADVVLSTLYVDEKNTLILKAKTTTRENGSYQLEMTYGKYRSYGLPDNIIFTFNTKDYKLPKGITFDFDDGTTPQTTTPRSNTGRADIRLAGYTVNQGVSDDVFRK